MTAQNHHHQHSQPHPHQQSHQQHQQRLSRPAPPELRCNRCEKPMTGTVFALSCDCCFCEDCTYEHFKSSTICPCCKKPVNENGFIEVAVAAATANAGSGGNNAAGVIDKDAHYKALLAQLFTKHHQPSGSGGSSSSALTFPELMQSLMRILEDVRRAMRFTLKQTIISSRNGATRLEHEEKEVQALEHNVMELKQAAAARKIESDRMVAELDSKLHAVQAEYNHYRQELPKLRALAVEAMKVERDPRHGGNHSTHIPQSPSNRSTGSGSTGGGRRGPSSISTSQGRNNSGLLIPPGSHHPPTTALQQMFRNQQQQQQQLQQPRPHTQSQSQPHKHHPFQQQQQQSRRMPLMDRSNHASSSSSFMMSSTNSAFPPQTITNTSRPSSSSSSSLVTSFGFNNTNTASANNAPPQQTQTRTSMSNTMFHRHTTPPSRPYSHHPSSYR